MVAAMDVGLDVGVAVVCGFGHTTYLVEAPGLLVPTFLSS